MMFSPTNKVSTRRAKLSHELWKPHKYQERAVEFLCQQNSAALFLDPGLGKTAITLAAFATLKDAGQAKRMLVVAPLRVCQLVWPQEVRKWTQFRDLRVSVLHGDKKAERLKDDADIWLINPEGCKWLADRYFGRSLPFDTVVIDELTKFKNHRAERAKALRPRLKNVRRRWGLTGTPAPNGYMDLFGQMLMLDDGAALGKYITHFRDQYFQPDFNGFDYVLQPGGARRIEERIRPYVLRMSAEDYLDLPPSLDDPRIIELPPEARRTYNRMKKDMLAELPEGVVTGANAAAVYSKLAQMANGAVYLGDGAQRSVAHIHDAKLDTLADLIEELGGQQLIVAYEFNHDLSRLHERFGQDTPYLGSGVSEKKAQAIEAAWNAGEIPLLFAHPASVGHGLNLQEGGASHIAWFSPIWDLELYEQFIRRLLRQGTTAKHIINHLLIVANSIDELKLAALHDKDMTQARLLASLNDTILRDADNPAAGRTAVRETKESNMVMKLSRQTAAAQEDDEAPRTITPKGWGKPAAVAQDDADEETTQRDRIRAKIAPKQIDIEDAIEEAEEAPVASRARGMFSRAVQEKLAGETTEAPDVEPAPKKTKMAISDTPEDREPEPRNFNAAKVAQPAQAAQEAASPGSHPQPYHAIQLTLHVTAAQAAAVFAAIDKALDV